MAQDFAIIFPHKSCDVLLFSKIEKNCLKKFDTCVRAYIDFVASLL